MYHKCVVKSMGEKDEEKRIDEGIRMDKCLRCFKDISWIEERVRLGRQTVQSTPEEGSGRVVEAGSK